MQVSSADQEALKARTSSRFLGSPPALRALRAAHAGRAGPRLRADGGRRQPGSPRHAGPLSRPPCAGLGRRGAWCGAAGRRCGGSVRADIRQGAGWDVRTDGHGWDGRTPAALPWPPAAVPVWRPPRPVPVPQPGIVAGDEILKPFPSYKLSGRVAWQFSVQYFIAKAFSEKFCLRRFSPTVPHG